MDVPIGDLILDPRLQMRVNISMEVIDDYAERIDRLPPCKVVMGPEGQMWLTGGFHRHGAHVKTNKTTVACEVRHGTFLDALVEACGENDEHGIRRSDDDKERSVKALLGVPEWSGRTDRAIADACRVSHPFVAKVRESVGNDSNTTRSGKDGRTYKASKPKIYCPHCTTLKRKELEPKKNCPMCAELRKTGKKNKKASQTEPTEVVDAFGTPVPKRCLDAYCDPWIQESIDFIGETVGEFWKRKFANGMDKRKKHYPWYNVKDFADGVGFAGNYLDQLLDHLKEFRPAGVCPKCEGKGCADCKMAGLVPRKVYKELKK